MFEIEVELRNFGGLRNGQRLERFWSAELIKSAITVGYSGWRTIFRYGKPSLFNTLRRIFTIKAAFVNRNRRLCASALYLNAEPTEKGVISNCLGNTVCALLAERVAQVPWLLSLSAYEQALQPGYAPGGSRPDFVGQTVQGDWYVFEAKGTSSDKVGGPLREAKAQSAMVIMINGAPVACGLASVSYVGPGDELRAIWDDPPLGLSEGSNLDLPDDRYFHAYYGPILGLLAAVAPLADSEYGRMAYLPSVDVFVGLDERVRSALQLERFREVREFAYSRLPQRQSGAASSDGTMLFPDGLIVRAGATWREIFETDSPRDRAR